MKRLRVVHRSPVPLAVVFVGAGTLHFVKTGFYLAIMPPWLPWHRELVYVSGVAEIAGGVAALVPRLRPWSRWGLILLLIAVFPANVHAAVNAEDIKGFSGPPLLLWLRLPFQALFIAWVWSATRERS